MGFGVSIMARHRDLLPNPACSPKEFYEKHNEWWDNGKWVYMDMLIEDWCSSGNFWFRHLDKYLTPIDNGFYVIDKDNYGSLIKFANAMMEKIEAKPYYVKHSMTYVDREDDNAGYLCRPVDGIQVWDNDGHAEEIWTGGGECDFTGVLNVEYYEYYSVVCLIKAVMEVGKHINDGDIVWIHGGW